MFSTPRLFSTFLVTNGLRERWAPIISMWRNQWDNPARAKLRPGEVPTYPPEYDQITQGMTRKRAAALFREACNHRHTLFVTEKWFARYRKYLRWGLHRRITADEAEALKATLRQEVSLAYLCVWLWKPRRLPWVEHLGQFRTNQELARAAAEAARRTPGAGFFPWVHVEACRQTPEASLSSKESSPKELFPQLPARDRDYYLPSAIACPRCSASASELSWIYFVSPKLTWEKLCGRAGWLTVCDKCRIQVQFFMELLN
jgi:hypothetical protein